MPGLTPSGRALSLLKAALRRLAGLGGWRLVLAQVLGTLLVVYLALEGWARLFPPKDQMVWPLVQDPAVGSRFQANSRVVLSNGLDFRVEERTNEAGFLDRPLPPVARTAGTCRIAFLGDSFVEAAQVPNAQKVQAELERLMKARWPALGVETMAFGFSGTGQLNQLGYLEAYVRPRKPDLIVLVFVSNDFANNSALLEAIRVGWHPAHTPRVFAREAANGAIEVQPIDADWLSWRLPAARDERPWLHARLHRASRFYRWLYAKLTLQYPALAQRMGREPTEADRTSARIDGIAGLDPQYARLLKGWSHQSSPNLDLMFQEPDPLPEAFRQALRFTGFAFDAYKARAATDGARLVVLSTHEVRGRVEQRLRNMLKEKDIPLLSLNEHIAARNGKTADAHWRHDGHWSPQGHTWAAETVLDYIADARVCGPR